MGEVIAEEELLSTKVLHYGITNALRYYGGDDEEWSEKNILDMVHLKNDRLSMFLSCAGDFGMLNSLFALKLIVDVLESEDVKSWFNCQLKDITDYQLICKLVDEFRHNIESKVVSDIRDSKEIFFLFSEVAIREYIWNKLEKNYINSIPVTDSRIVGVWHLGATINKNSRKYLEVLDKKVFPFMLLKAKELKDGINCTERIYYNFFTAILHSYMVEAVWLGKIASFNVVDGLLQREVNEIAKKYNNDFYKLVCEIVGVDVNSSYISKTYIDQLARLDRECEYFKSLQGGKEMDELLPLFYLFVGENDEAYLRLIKMANSPIVSNKFDCAYMAALYRCLLVTDDVKKRYALLNACDGIYSNSSILPDFIDVINDFADFYTNWTERIKNDLGKIYDEDFVVICRELVITEKICTKFAEIISMLDSTSEEAVFEGIELAINLVNGLTSHEDHDIRISRESLVSVFPKYEGKLTKFEIFDVNLYKSVELKTIRRLKSRLVLLSRFLFSKKRLANYKDIKKNVEAYWDLNDKDVLCQKLMTAFKGIQSDPQNIWRSDNMERHEDSLNNLVAFFLMGFYGDGRIHREKPQGYSGEGKNQGELDIVIYKDDFQFAIIESLRLLHISKKGNLNETHKADLDRHLGKLLNSYDPRGVGMKVLTIYAYVRESRNLYESIEDYLVKYFLQKKYEDYFFEKLQKISSTDESSILHHKVNYRHEGKEKEIHIFTVLMKLGYEAV